MANSFFFEVLAQLIDNVVTCHSGWFVYQHQSVHH
jgi:hypothetical protein